ncbi:hypothetical protein DM860_013465 [Cuscuta australis]|uniref:Uncharacterized protein n=1 Tax=Cuscuta australis TaxID=267555 RepID=A0A328CZX8_9ASTE|nr:hypothetical protein DM860_013465 [Cuscuta australis]
MKLCLGIGAYGLRQVGLRQRDYRRVAATVVQTRRGTAVWNSGIAAVGRWLLFAGTLAIDRVDEPMDERGPESLIE